MTLQNQLVLDAATDIRENVFDTDDYIDAATERAADIVELCGGDRFDDILVDEVAEQIWQKI